jgi:hypothetical protein
MLYKIFICFKYFYRKLINFFYTGIKYRITNNFFAMINQMNGKKLKWL